MNPRYPFGVYTISNRARSASYATSPSDPATFVASQSIILYLKRFVKTYFYRNRNLNIKLLTFCEITAIIIHA